MTKLIEILNLKRRFRLILSFIVLSSILGLYSFKHPYHVAYTTIEWFKESKKMKIVIKAFYHDLEDAVNLEMGVEIDIKNHKDTGMRDSLVYKYIKNHFQLKNNNDVVDYDEISIGFKDEFIQIKLEKNDISPEQIWISNSILYDSEPSQTNVFNFISFGQTTKKESRKIVNPVKEITYNFN